MGLPVVSDLRGESAAVVSKATASTTNITREIYTHVTPPMKSDAADRVADVIFGRPSTGSA